MSAVDFYALLGVTPRATREEVVRALKTARARLHPDRAASLSDEEVRDLFRRNAPEFPEPAVESFVAGRHEALTSEIIAKVLNAEFARIEEASRTLMDSVKRAAYDKARAASAPPSIRLTTTSIDFGVVAQDRPLDYRVEVSNDGGTLEGEILRVDIADGDDGWFSVYADEVVDDTRYVAAFKLSVNIGDPGLRGRRRTHLAISYGPSTATLTVSAVFEAPYRPHADFVHVPDADPGFTSPISGATSASKPTPTASTPAAVGRSGTAGARHTSVFWVGILLVAAIALASALGDRAAQSGGGTVAALPEVPRGIDPDWPRVIETATPQDTMVVINPCLLYKCEEAPIRVASSLETLYAAPSADSQVVGQVGFLTRGVVDNEASIIWRPATYLVTQDSVWTDVYPPGTRVRLKKGERFYTYADWGEACYTMWLRGKLYGYASEPHQPRATKMKSGVGCLLLPQPTTLTVNESGLAQNWLTVIDSGWAQSWLRMRTAQGLVGWMPVKGPKFMRNFIWSTSDAEDAVAIFQGDWSGDSAYVRIQGDSFYAYVKDRERTGTLVFRSAKLAPGDGVVLHSTTASADGDWSLMSFEPDDVFLAGTGGLRSLKRRAPMIEGRWSNEAGRCIELTEESPDVVVLSVQDCQQGETIVGQRVRLSRSGWDHFSYAFESDSLAVFLYVDLRTLRLQLQSPRDSIGLDRVTSSRGLEFVGRTFFRR